MRTPRIDSAARAVRNSGMVAAHVGGQAVPAIAERFALSAGTVQRVLRRAGRYPRRPCEVCGGENRAHYHAKTCMACASVVTRIETSASRAVNAEIRRGALPSPKDCTCVDCAEQAREYEHREYAKPLAVVPVCRGCNLRRGPAIDLYDLARAVIFTPAPSPQPAAA